MPKSNLSVIKVFIILIVVILLLIAFTTLKQFSQNSAIRAFIAQISYYDSAINQFRQKYDMLPGDAINSKEFGLSDKNTDGNNDGIIRDENGGINLFSGEIANFWLHLSRSGFINQNFDGSFNNDAKIDLSFPRSKIGSNIGIVAFGDNGKNYYQVGILEVNNKGIIMTDNSLKPIEASEIDVKIDDGFALSGRVVAVLGNSLNNIAQSGKCISRKEYNFKTNIPVCQIRIEMGLAR